ncbi:MAG: biotin transporter BioY [Lachnospiraceae bacterium]|nr:biotin transporter BioY [Lachnospiraceae bacterium]
MSIQHNRTLRLRMTLYSALFAALMVIGAYIAVPLPFSPVPIVLTDFFIMSAGIFLGAKYGIVSVTLYLFLGSIGLPVFAGGNGGLYAFLGPTGGFLLGYVPLVAVTGYVFRKCKGIPLRAVLALLSGNVVLYAIGIPFLKLYSHSPWLGAITVGLIPFLPGLILKIALVVVLERLLRSQLRFLRTGIGS